MRQSMSSASQQFLEAGNQVQKSASKTRNKDPDQDQGVQIYRFMEHSRVLFRSARMPARSRKLLVLAPLPPLRFRCSFAVFRSTPGTGRPAPDRRAVHAPESSRRARPSREVRGGCRAKPERVPPIRTDHQVVMRGGFVRGP